MEHEKIGVVGLGLMGRGIVACLLGHGFRVTACDNESQTHEPARSHIAAAVEELVTQAGYPRDRLDWADRYIANDKLDDMKGCAFVIESIGEDFAGKQAVYDELEAVVGPNVPIASNTSALPISLLQKDRRHPERLVGMHWGEPAHVLRFIEIIRGEQTSAATFDATVRLAEALGKEPSLVQKDVRGFITNRLMYAMLREAFHLLESGVADVETIDRSFRNDMGWWAMMAGPFRWMDLTGLPAYAAVMRDLFPELSNRTHVPQIMRELVESGALGTSNGKGFYNYSPEEAAHWNRVWSEVTWDIRHLADKHLPLKEEKDPHASPH